MAKKEEKVTVTKEADGLIRGDRQAEYGHPSINFERIARAWNAYMHKRPTTDEKPLTHHDVAFMMVLVKAIRGAEGYKRDTAVDIIGYAALDAVLAGDDEL
jgi:hypothetical protein